MEHLGLDETGGNFQLPVATMGNIAGRIIRGRHIRARQRGHGLDKAVFRRAVGNVAAIEKEVAIGAQRPAPGGHTIGILIKIGCVECCPAQLETVFAAVGEDVYTGKVVVLSQYVTDLLYFVARGVKHHNAGISRGHTGGVLAAVPVGRGAALENAV